MVAGARAPSVTPFLAGGAAGAAAGASGALAQVAKRRVALTPIAHALIVMGVAFIVALPAGAVKYTYGDAGSLTITLSVSPLVVDWRSNVPLVGEISLYNDGGSTVRVRPHFEVRITDQSGFPRPVVIANCAVPATPPPTEHDLVEIPPGGSLSWPFTILLGWEDQSGLPPPCGATLIATRGPHLVSGGFDSRPFAAFGLVPVWTNTLTTESAALTIQ